MLESDLMKRILVLVLFSFLLAPAPWGIALNHQTKECAGYWAGDEYVSYKLPEGWQAYYPGDGAQITTEVGACKWSDVDWDRRAEDCCRELGYTFVSANIGERQGFTLFSWMIVGATIAACLLALLILAGVILVFVRLRAKHRATPQ
jgi:hypothetical protein